MNPGKSLIENGELGVGVNEPTTQASEMQWNNIAINSKKKLTLCTLSFVF